MGEGSILNDYWSNNKTLLSFSFCEPIIKISSVSLHTWLNYEEERRGEVTKHQGEGKPVILFLPHFIFSLQFSAFWFLRSSLTSTLTRLTLHTSKAEKQGRETSERGIPETYHNHNIEWCVTSKWQIKWLNVNTYIHTGWLFEWQRYFIVCKSPFRFVICSDRN